MGKRGRQAKPVNLKLVTGERIRPHEKHSAAVGVFQFPDKPKTVADDPAIDAVWEDTKWRCEACGYVGMVDAADLELFCFSIASFREAKKMLDEQGKVLDDGKRLYSNPWVKIALDHLDRAHRIACNFGFNPSSRNNIIMPQKPADDEQSYDDFLKSVDG